VLLDVVLISVTAASVASLLGAIRSQDRTLEVVSKVAASASFVVLGVARWTPENSIGAWLIAGLVLCAAGDVLLLGDRTFDVGLISFLLGHLAYVAGFHTALPLGRWPVLVLVPLALAGAAVLSWLWPRLGRRRVPVAAYVAAITAMVWGGMSSTTASVLPWTAAVGAVLFYLSDLAVARQRFVHASFVNRALGLPLYYAAQILIALTVGA